MKYLFFIFPAYMLYYNIATYHKPDWGFGILVAFEMIAIQIVVTVIALLGVWLTAKLRLPEYRKMAFFALLASVLISFLS